MAINEAHRQIIKDAAKKIDKSSWNLLNNKDLSSEKYAEIFQIVQSAKEYSKSTLDFNRDVEFFQKLEKAIEIMMDTEMFSGSKADKIMAEIRAITGNGSSQNSVCIFNNGDSQTTIFSCGNKIQISQTSINSDNVIGDISF